MADISSMRLNWSTFPVETELTCSDDFDKWYRKAVDYFQFNSALGWVTGETRMPFLQPASSRAQDTVYSKELAYWKLVDNKAQAAIKSMCGDGPRDHIEDAVETGEMSTSADMWAYCKTYKQSGSVTFITQFRELLRTDLAGSKSIQDYARKLRKLASEVARAGPDNSCKISDTLLAGIFIMGLDDSWEGFVTSFNLHSPITGNTVLPPARFDTLVQAAAETEHRQSTSYGSTIASASLARGKGPGRDFSKACTYAPCGRTGHLEKDCYMKYPDRKPKWLKLKEEEFKHRRQLKAQKRASESSPNNPSPATSALAVASHPPIEDEDSFSCGYMASPPLQITSGHWVLDSGATQHMTNDISIFTRLDSTQKASINMANDGAIKVEGIGEAVITITTDEGPKEMKMHDVWYAPGLANNLLSWYRLRERGFQVAFSDDFQRFTISKGDKCYGQGFARNALWLLETISEHVSQTTPTKALVAFRLPDDQELQLWHQRLAHLGQASLTKVIKMTDGILLSGEFDKPRCEHCIRAKTKSKPHNSPLRPGTKPMEMIHSDIMGPIKYIGRDIKGRGRPEGKYIVTFLDDYSSMAWVFITDNKDAETVYRCFTNFIQHGERASGNKLRYFHSDGDGAYKKQFVQYFEMNGVEHEPTQPYSPEMNGKAERLNGVIMERVRAVMEAQDIPEYLVTEIIKSVAYLRNRCPTVKEKTPWELFYNERPWLGHVRILGCKAFVRDPKPDGKLAARANECILVGFEGNSIYRLWDEANNIFIRSRDVEFIEEPSIVSNKGPGKQKRKRDFYIPAAYTQMDRRPSKLPRHDHDSGGEESARTTDDIGTLGPSEIDDDDDDTIIVNTASRSTEPLVASLATTRVVPRSGSTKISGSDHFRGSHALHHRTNGPYHRFLPTYPADIDVTSNKSLTHGSPPEIPPTFSVGAGQMAQAVALFTHTLRAATSQANNDSLNPTLGPEPQTWKQSQQTPEADQWQSAAQAEFHSLNDIMHTWDLVERPKDKSVLKGRWVFKRKLGPHREVLKYKARWVARGDMQEASVDYEETFSSVVKSMAYKMMFNRAAVLDLEIEQMDVDVAFLNSTIDYEVYVEQPEGFEDGTGRVCKLNRTLYGLRQSPRAWYLTLKDFLHSYGLSVAATDNSVFFNEYIQVAVYVDDLLIFGADKAKVQHLKNALNGRFSMKDLGPVKWYLGITIERNRSERTIKLSQKAYLEKVLSRFNMLHCNADEIPMTVGQKLQGASSEYEAEGGFIRTYQEAIGSLMYLMLCTRPHIAYSISNLSKFSANPTREHWKAVKKVLRYLKGTINAKLVFRGNVTHIQGHGQYLLGGYTDAAFADCPDTRRSTSGYVFSVGSGAISWSSRRQSTVSTSTTESEYKGQFSAALEAMYLRNLAKDLWPEIIQGAIVVRADNNGAVGLAKNNMGHSRTKHFDVKLKLCQEVEEMGIVTYQRVDTDDNVADVLTKPLSRDRHRKLVEGFGLEVSWPGKA